MSAFQDIKNNRMPQRTKNFPPKMQVTKITNERK